ncbi:MAG: LPS assembly lipoprotein LptE [Planctomycetes bacterium]|nr:LPS assembly lipoprotein LptE [Planctomycetota bacterium]
MRKEKVRHAAWLLILFLGVFISAAGCRTTTRSGLPAHIRTVEVHIFHNKTMHKGIENWLAREIIDRLNTDARIRVVSRGGDAVITGEIKSVTRSTLRETTTNTPGTVLITVNAEYSFYDQIERRYIIDDAAISSRDTGLSYGIYEAARGEMPEQGERGAARAMAAEIVRRTVGRW